MQRGTFTVYQHPRQTKDGTVYRWYYYFYTQDGRKAQKACRGCATREQAEAYVRGLPVPAGIRARGGLIRDIAKDMFLEGSAHMERRRQLGKSTHPATCRESRRFVEVIIRQWGDVELGNLLPETVLAYLFSVQKAGVEGHRLDLYTASRLLTVNSLLFWQKHPK